MLPGASLAARFCWQGHTHRHTHVDSLTHITQTHTRSLTVPFAHGVRAGASLDTHTVDAHTFAHGARARLTLDTHLGASRLVSAGRGSTSGSGRCPSAFRGPPPLMLPGAALGSLAARFCWQGQALDGTRARFGAPPLDAARRLGSLAARFCWQTALQALDGARARFGAPLLMLPGAALGSLAARFCWQAHTHTRHTHVDSLTHTRQTHTRSLTVPFAHGARAGASLDTHTVDAHTFAHGARARFTLDTHLGASRLVSAGRGSTSVSGQCPSAFRGPPP